MKEDLLAPSGDVLLACGGSTNGTAGAGNLGLPLGSVISCFPSISNEIPPKSSHLPCPGAAALSGSAASPPSPRQPASGLWPPPSQTPSSQCSQRALAPKEGATPQRDSPQECPIPSDTAGEMPASPGTAFPPTLCTRPSHQCLELMLNLPVGLCRRMLSPSPSHGTPEPAVLTLTEPRSVPTYSDTRSPSQCIVGLP